MDKMHVFFYTKLKWGKNWPGSRENLVPICKSIFLSKNKKITGSRQISGRQSNDTADKNHSNI